MGDKQTRVALRRDETHTVRPAIGVLPGEVVSTVAADVVNSHVKVGAVQRREWSCVHARWRDWEPGAGG